MKNFIVIFLIFCLQAYADTPSPSASQPAPFPGTKTNWHGYDHYSFTTGGRNCRIVTPKKIAPGNPWIWRARFFGHEPQTDLALLAKGFHLAYIDVAGLYGCPKAVAIWDTFYKYLVEKHNFATKAALEGMSRGGLIIYNWASRNPAKVTCIYGDAPVCDIKSWPGPKGWGKCLKEYGLTPDQALKFKGNPIDNLAPLAKAGIPLLNICGGADKVVPFPENTAILAERYKKLGGMISVIIKKGVGHHPHSLKNPAPIVNFILHHTSTSDFGSYIFRDTVSGKLLPYRLLKPANYNASKTYPLILFLHGAGERGADNMKQLIHVVTIFAQEKNKKKYPCFVLAPQCPNGQQWVDVPWYTDSHILPEKPSSSMALTLKLMSKIKSIFSIDKKRLYVMGLSMGGFGTWDIITRYPKMFAAAVPMCGGADETKASLIAKIPVWDFHGGIDHVVKTIRSRNIIEAIRKAGGNPRYTEYPNVGHGCWVAASQEPGLLPWLFSKRLK